MSFNPFRRIAAAVNRHPFSAASVAAFLERDAFEDDLLALARAAGVYVDPDADMRHIEAYANGEVA